MKRSHSGSILDHHQNSSEPSHHHNVGVDNVVPDTVLATHAAAADAATATPLIRENQQPLNTRSTQLTLTSTHSSTGSTSNGSGSSVRIQASHISPPLPNLAPNVDAGILLGDTIRIPFSEPEIDAATGNGNDTICDGPLTVRGTCSQILDGDYSAGPPLRYDRKCWGFAYMRKRGKKRPGRVLVERNHQADCAAGPLQDSDTEDGESSSHQTHIRGWEGESDSD